MSKNGSKRKMYKIVGVHYILNPEGVALDGLNLSNIITTQLHATQLN